MQLTVTDYIVVRDGSTTITTEAPHPLGFDGSFFYEIELPTDYPYGRGNLNQRPILQFKMRASGEFRFQVGIGDGDTPEIDIEINDSHTDERTYYEVIDPGRLMIGTNRIRFQIVPSFAPGSSLTISDIVLFFQRRIDANPVPGSFV